MTTNSQYYQKYLKYKTKYIKLKNNINEQSNIKNNSKVNTNNDFQGIKCELTHLAIWEDDGMSDPEFVKEITQNKCQGDYKSYFTKWVYGTSKAPENKQTVKKFQQSFKFRNSLGDFLRYMLKENKMKFLGMC
ncbi:putative orfan [Tupanvirus soda lake]|uniref:Orfan n=1 Tax=Tupanvirus deep ocean TaxID=2126984 RepID=A0A2K9L370_9VIRU|nr:putative orfan [Tupanvirus soda lake]AUL77605.2 putative orfan [Tupanvirus soda lake]